MDVAAATALEKCPKITLWAKFSGLPKVHWLLWPAQKKENMTVQGKKSVHPILYGRNWII